MHRSVAAISGVRSAMHGTTILSVRKGNQVVIVADGQATAGHEIMKHNIVKLRRLGASKEVVVGYAGNVADAFTLVEMLEKKIDQYPGQMTRACVELTKSWRQNRDMPSLEAQLIVIDKNTTLNITGEGNLFSTEDNTMAIGSGREYAIAAARALLSVPASVQALSAEDIARRSMKIAADLDIYTNGNIMVETLESEEPV